MRECLGIYIYMNIRICPNCPHLNLKIFKKIYIVMEQVGDANMLLKRSFSCEVQFFPIWPRNEFSHIRTITEPSSDANWSHTHLVKAK